MEELWGMETYVRILDFDKRVRLPSRSTSDSQAKLFQKKLIVLSNSPKCYTSRHQDWVDLNLDFKVEAIREAAMEVTNRLEGVSRWKPNLVPRMGKH